LNSLSAKVWRRVASLPADIALGMTNVAPISSYLDQRKSAIEESYVAANSLSPNEASGSRRLKTCPSCGAAPK
jgi:hypothetical protein